MQIQKYSQKNASCRRSGVGKNEYQSTQTPDCFWVEEIDENEEEGKGTDISSLGQVCAQSCLCHSIVDTRIGIS